MAQRQNRRFNKHGCCTHFPLSILTFRRESRTAISQLTIDMSRRVEHTRSRKNGSKYRLNEELQNKLSTNIYSSLRSRNVSNSLESPLPKHYPKASRNAFEIVSMRPSDMPFDHLSMPT